MSHVILKEKLKIIGFGSDASKLFENYLKDRKQFTQVDGIYSNILGTNDHSVCQGSTLSGLLYLIFSLDIPKLFHNNKHNAIEDRNCNASSLKTYVDDIFPITVAKDGEDMKIKIISHVISHMVTGIFGNT